MNGWPFRIHCGANIKSALHVMMLRKPQLCGALCVREGLMLLHEALFHQDSGYPVADFYSLGASSWAGEHQNGLLHGRLYGNVCFDRSFLMASRIWSGFTGGFSPFCSITSNAISIISPTKT